MTIKQLQLNSRYEIERAIEKTDDYEAEQKSALRKALDAINEQEVELSEYLERGFTILSQTPTKNGVNFVMYRAPQYESSRIDRATDSADGFPLRSIEHVYDKE